MCQNRRVHKRRAMSSMRSRSADDTTDVLVDLDDLCEMLSKLAPLCWPLGPPVSLHPR